VGPRTPGRRSELLNGVRLVLLMKGGERVSGGRERGRQWKDVQRQWESAAVMQEASPCLLKVLLLVKRERSDEEREERGTSRVFETVEAN
jgi:hypothetical protein